MDTFDFKSNLKVLCEIIMKKDKNLYNCIKGLKLSAISNPRAVSERIMENIRRNLIEWEINIQSFENVISNENALETMQYFIETIQADKFKEFDTLKDMKEILNKDIRSVDKLFDCLEAIPDLLESFENYINIYNINIDQRVKIHKSLKDFASDLFYILSSINKKVINLRKEENFNKMLYEYMLKLIQMSIVITTYPPRTIKKGTPSKAGTHFKVTLSCLIEQEKMFSKEHLQAYFLTEEDFKNFILKKELKDDCKIIFSPNNSKTNSWELKNMLWNPPERLNANRRKTERITTNKAIILIKFVADATPHLFHTIHFENYLLSDTVISIVHTNQEIEALITLFWDDYFRVDRSAFLKTGIFKCKDVILIQELTEALSYYFEKETSRGLTPSNIDFLNKKLLKTISNGQVQFHHFATQNASDKSISFGNWIMSIIKLLKICGICDLWKTDLIDGFMKKESEAIFKDLLPGTFSLRFSEKNAKIGVLFKTPNNNLEAWNPFSADECRNRNICERLIEYHELQYIRSATGEIHKKEEVLSQFIQSKDLDEGYTERGQLSKILCSNIYSEPFGDFMIDEDSMDINIDPLICGTFNDDVSFDSTS